MKKLVIVGRANGYQTVNKKTVRDIWAVSSIYEKLNHADKVFQLHSPQHWENWILDVQPKLVTIKNYYTLSNKEIIPVKKLIKKYGPIFHSSITWMLAYADYLGYKDIEIKGVHMQHHTEYGKQRDSLFFLMGMLKSKGIKISVPLDSEIYLSTKLYGDFNDSTYKQGKKRVETGSRKTRKSLNAGGKKRS